MYFTEILWILIRMRNSALKTRLISDMIPWSFFVVRALPVYANQVNSYYDVVHYYVSTVETSQIISFGTRESRDDVSFHFHASALISPA